MDIKQKIITGITIIAGSVSIVSATNQFSSVATTLKDLGNATLDVIGTLATGTNAGTLISGVIVIAIVLYVWHLRHKVNKGM